ncbi:hypothetical protein [Anaplasma marginale]|uniref:hypothetical protein n=1 Tax=Anaplasma marginale TaxID=770 RepID=UPI001CC257BC|nr:hypothetical protein [Anaplasma marginale]
MTAGALLQQGCTAIAEDYRGISKSKEQKAICASEEKGAEVSAEGVQALIRDVRGIVNTEDIAAAVMRRLRDSGVRLPQNARAQQVAKKAVEAMVEELAKRLSESLGLLVQVHTGKMTKEELEAKHPRTASAMNSVSDSFQRRGLTSDSSVQDVINNIGKSSPGVSSVEQRTTAEDKAAGAVPAVTTARAASLVLLSVCMLMICGTIIAMCTALTLESPYVIAATAVAGVAAVLCSVAIGLSIWDLVKSCRQAKEDSAQPPTSTADPILKEGMAAASPPGQSLTHTEVREHQRESIVKAP